MTTPNASKVGSDPHPGDGAKEEQTSKNEYFKTACTIFIAIAILSFLYSIIQLATMSIRLHKATMIGDNKQVNCGDTFMEAETARYAAYNTYNNNVMDKKLETVTDSHVFPFLVVIYIVTCLMLLGKYFKYIKAANYKEEYAAFNIKDVKIDQNLFFGLCLLAISLAVLLLLMWIQQRKGQKLSFNIKNKTDSGLIYMSIALIITFLFFSTGDRKDDKPTVWENALFMFTTAIVMMTVYSSLIGKMRSSFTADKNKYAEMDKNLTENYSKQVVCTLITATVLSSLAFKTLDKNIAAPLIVVILSLSFIALVANYYRGRLQSVFSSKVSPPADNPDSATYGFTTKKFNAEKLATDPNGLYYVTNANQINPPPYKSSIPVEDRFIYVNYAAPPRPLLLAKDGVTTSVEDTSFIDYKYSLQMVDTGIRKQVDSFMWLMMITIFFLISVPVYMSVHSVFRSQKENNSVRWIVVGLVCTLILMMFISPLAFWIGGGAFS